jgi:hypothetical protein
MNAIYWLLIISILSGFFTSMISYYIHNSGWHAVKNKCSLKVVNLFISNIYQFNGIFLNVVSLSVAIATSVIVSNIIFIHFYCDSIFFDIEAAVVIFLSVTLFRALFLAVAYYFFYEEEMLKS